MVFVTFFGKQNTKLSGRPANSMIIPMVVLAFFSLAGGYIELPENIAHLSLFSNFIEKTLPAVTKVETSRTTELIFQLIAAFAAIAGLFTAYRFYFNKSFPAGVPRRNVLQKFFYNGWNFDLLYNKIVVNPVVFLSKIDKNDFIDLFYRGLASVTRGLNKTLSATQNGKISWYAMVIAIGAILTLTILFY
jgi:NADH-quinone oxidoreductase subunit L